MAYQGRGDGYQDGLQMREIGQQVGPLHRSLFFNIPIESMMLTTSLL